MKWIDSEGIKDKEEITRHCAVAGEFAHKLGTYPVCPSNGLAKVDGKEWEMFSFYDRATINGTTYLWGQRWEGLGLINCMVREDQTRDLDDAEKKFWSGRGMVMVGSHTGKTSYGFRCPELD
jgi:hypothetical protein